VATPIVAGNYVFISSDYQAGCALLEVSADGPGFKARPVYVRRDKLMRNHFSTCVLHDGCLYGFDVSGHGSVGRLKCVDLRTAEQKWETGALARGSVLYADGHLLALAQDGVLALVEATPEGFRQQGRCEVLQGSECWAPPALAAGLLYVRDGGELICLDLRK
jgi:hypothetical protein